MLPIDPDRLEAVLESASEARARLEALREEAESLRDALEKAELAESVSRRTALHSDEPIPQLEERIERLKGRIARVNERRQAAMDELRPVLDLAKRSRDYVIEFGNNSHREVLRSYGF